MNATGCDHPGLWRQVALSYSKGCRHTVQIQKILYILWLDDSIVHIWEHMPWHRKFFFVSLRGECLCLPSGKVLLLMAVYSTARAWIFTGRTKRCSTSTSHKYLFSTFLPASAFIYWLFSNFVWLRRYNRHTNRTGRRLKKKKKDSGWVRGTFSCLLFTFHESYLHPLPG